MPFFRIMTLASIFVTGCILASCNRQHRSTPLPESRPIHAASPGAGVDLYHFQAAVGDYQEIVVEQLGLDVMVSVYDPTGILRFSRDTLISNLGREVVCFIGEAGRWRVEISAFRPNEPGNYRITRTNRKSGAAERRRSEAFALSHGAKSKDSDAALKDSQRAGQLWQAEGDLEQQAMELWRQALLLGKLGHTDAKIATYNRVAQLLEALAEEDLLAMVQHNLGTAYYYRGQLEQSIDHYQRALAKRTEPNRNRADTLTSLALAYVYAGSWQQARPLLKECSLICRAVGNRDKLARVHATLGWLFHGEGQLSQSLAQYEKALELIGDEHPEVEVVIRNYEARTRSFLGEYQKALALFEAASALLPEKSDWRPHLEIGMAEALIGLQRFAEASAKMTAAQAVFQASKIPAERAHCLYHLARAQQGLGQPRLALTHMETLWNVMAGMQTETLAHGLRAEYEARRIHYTELYLDLLVETDADPARRLALEHGERVRARALTHSLVTLDYSPSTHNPELADHLQGLRARISASALKISRQGGRQGLGTETELNDLLRRYDQALSTTAPAQADVVDSLGPFSIEKIQQNLLDAQTGLLFFAMGSQQVYLWVVDQQGAEFFKLGSRRELESDALNFYEAIRDPEAKANRTKITRIGKRLTSVLLEPIASRIAGWSRLLIAADSALHYLPFAALRDVAGNPLIVNREIVYLPSCSVLAALKQRHEKRIPGQGTAILAAPAYGGDFPALIHATKEAENIHRIAPDPVMLQQGTQASKALVLSGALRNARYIHFASHGLFMERRPELSSLVLATRDDQGRLVDGLVHPHEIEGLDLKTDLVVLSACETALGKELRGEGLVGFPNSFLKAGSSGVLVSLWPVDDAATSQLMTHFYKALFAGRAGPAAALRQAQATLQANPDLQDPYYWAGFVYQGVW